MAEDVILRESRPGRGLERRELVDALAGERAEAEEVLVNVRRGRGVRVNSRGAGDELRETRSPCGRQREADPRLQDRVTVDDPPPRRIELRKIQRLGQGRDQPPCRIPWQL